jgi:hypothetical protein
MNLGLLDREVEDCVAGIDARSFYQSSSHTRFILAVAMRNQDARGERYWRRAAPDLGVYE